MTDPTEAPDAPRDVPPPHVPPPLDDRPVGLGTTLGAGCLGFVAFFVVLAVVGGMAAVPNEPLAGIIVLVVGALIVVALFVAVVRSATRRGRALLVRGAIGFGIAAAIFGGCLAAISGTNFH
jgi:hypothetical protein